jgi:membrane protein YdbS with pleckstrin-like domain
MNMRSSTLLTIAWLLSLAAIGAGVLFLDLFPPSWRPYVLVVLLVVGAVLLVALIPLLKRAGRNIDKEMRDVDEVMRRPDTRD